MITEQIGLLDDDAKFNQAVLRLNGIDRKGQLSLDTDYDEVQKRLASKG